MSVIVVHGGAGGTSLRTERGCQLAAQAGLEILGRGGCALDAVVASVKWMENSRLFNAGWGSILRYDPEEHEVMEMDAVVASTAKEKVYGAVGAVTGVKNPVLLALAVLAQTPHNMLTGEGALDLARKLELEPHPGPTQTARSRLEVVKRRIAQGRMIAPDADMNLEAFREMMRQLGEEVSNEAPKEGDTVGAIALDDKGVIALAGSTGGSSVMIRGRIGDVPVRSSGWQIGEHGAVLSTGYGEQIMRREGAGRVYGFMAQGISPQRACDQVAEEFPTEVGFIALNKQELLGIGANCKMATYPLKDWLRS